MRLPAAGCLLLLLAAALAGCASPPPAGGGGTGEGPTGATGASGTARPEAGFHPLVRLGTDMGDVYVEVFEEMVPLTAANFLKYARDGFYEGIRFHRVIGPSKSPPEGFMLQTGDPNTRDPSKGRETWGVGDPNLPRIPDEFTAALRHDKAGVLSMANAGPSTGSSQFFITLSPQQHLDDKHAIFGQVKAGMDVVRAIGNVKTDVRDAPVDDVVIRSTEVIPAARAAGDVRRGLEAWTYDATHNATANHTIIVGAVVRNTGNVRLPVDVSMEAPEGWQAQPFWPPDANVSAQASQMVLFHIRVPPGAAPGEHPVRALFNVPGAQAEAPMTVRVGVLGRIAGDGAQVAVHYIGTMPDGRIFDTSRSELAFDDEAPKFTSVFQRRPANQYATLDFQLGGQGLIEGFNLGTRLLREGESRVVVVPPEQAYGFQCPPQRGNQPCLATRTLLFTIELVRVG